MFHINIPLLSMALNQGQVQQQASLSVMKKVLDQAEGNAEFLNKMMGEADVRALEKATQPHLGSNIDIKL